MILEATLSTFGFKFCALRKTVLFLFPDVADLLVGTDDSFDQGRA